MKKILFILLLISSNVYAGNYTLVTNLTEEEKKFVQEHEEVTNYAMKHTLKEYKQLNYMSEECLELVEKVIQQSYEGCILTTKLKANIDPDTMSKKEIEKITKRHNAHTKKMKESLCKSAMKAAKYHKQQAYCRLPMEKIEGWFTVANYLLEKKYYKYIGIYVKKTDILWRDMDWDEKDIDAPLYKYHPVNLAGNIRNMAYDKD